MNAARYRFCLGALLLVETGALHGQTPPNSTHEFFTEEYVIRMRVSFPASFAGTRLVVYRSTDPGKEVCLSAEGRPAGCIANFVGALAVVAFAVERAAGDGPAPASLREVVTLVEQSPGLPERPPFRMGIPLANGRGSDVQVFGYDETPLPPSARAAERQAAQAAWRRYRQELFLNQDRQPFAVIEWLHTTTRIHLLQVTAPPNLHAHAPEWFNSSGGATMSSTSAACRASASGPSGA